MAERETIEKAVKSLGYCCLFAFFKLFKRTGMIAVRLGFGDRAIRYHKRAFKDGKLSCEKCDKCLKGKLF